MPNRPKITEKQIQARVGERSFRLGKEYYHNGAIFNPRREGLTIKAQCEGSSGGPYRVQATFGSKGISEADCSCPVGGGGACKHVAAMLLTWLYRPEAFAESESLDQSLQRRSKEELIVLIRQMLRQEPDLESLLDTPLPFAGSKGKPATPETYRRQAQGLIRSTGGEWGEVRRLADKLSALCEIGEGFADEEDYQSAAAVYEGICSAVLEVVETFDDEDGHLSDVVFACVDGLGRCLAGAKANAALRQAILKALFDVCRADIDIGGIGLSDTAEDLILTQVNAEERRTVAEWVREAMPKGKRGDSWQREAYEGMLEELDKG